MGGISAACDFPIKSLIKGDRGRKIVIISGTQGPWVETSHFSWDDVCFRVQRGPNYSTIVVGYDVTGILKLFAEE